MPISFAVLILIVRKFPKVDMIPLQLVAGIFAMIIGLLIWQQLLYHQGYILGFLLEFSSWIWFFFITIGARSTQQLLLNYNVN